VDAPLGAANVIVSPAAGQNSAPFSITLTQFAPVLSPGGNGSPNLAFHLSGGGSPVTNANPAIPGETLGLIAYGLGATNPVVPTGTVGPSNPAAVTVATPTVFVAGQAASNVSASLTNNQVGAYFISFAVPPNLTTGNYATALSIGGVTSGLVSVPVFVGPVISSVANAASNIAFNAPIAQGAIFVLKGTNLGPANIAISPTPFQSTSVSGTSVSVTISGTKVDALMYYTSAGQVAALLPSNTPVGTGTITVTNNGQVGVAAPITVVASNLGIFTIDSTGEGPGIVTYADYSLVSAAKADPCGGPNTSCGAANPGDTLILWATGLGPINGSDAKGDGLGVAQTSVPATLWLGGVQATIVYQGRSGCCVGEDQLVFTVPDTVPTGCAVPMVVQIGNQIGNSTVLPVAKGSRDCTPNSPAIAAVNVEQGVMAGPISVGIIELGKFGNGNGTGYEDEAGFQFLKIVSYAPGTQPFFASWIDDQPIGTCTVFSHLGGHLEPPLKDTDLAGIDAGPSFTVKGPDGSVAVKAGFVEFKGSLSPTGTFLVPGAFSVSGTGGADVGPFTANITVPPLATLSSPGNNAAVTRSSGMTITWTGGDPNGNLVIKVYGATDNSFNTGSRAECVVPAKPGTFTIPPYIMEALPAGNFAGFTIAPARTELPFKATGLSFGGIDINFDGTGFGYGAGTGSLTLK
jgi:uncharacterized protein (TIGR03437 family)